MRPETNDGDGLRENGEQAKADHGEAEEAEADTLDETA